MCVYVRVCACGCGCGGLGVCVGGDSGERVGVCVCGRGGPSLHSAASTTPGSRDACMALDSHEFAGMVRRGSRACAGVPKVEGPPKPAHQGLCDQRGAHQPSRTHTQHATRDPGWSSNSKRWHARSPAHLLALAAAGQGRPGYTRLLCPEAPGWGKGLERPASCVLMLAMPRRCQEAAAGCPVPVWCSPWSLRMRVRVSGAGAWTVRCQRGDALIRDLLCEDPLAACCVSRLRLRLHLQGRQGSSGSKPEMAARAARCRGAGAGVGWKWGRKGGGRKGGGAQGWGVGEGAGTKRKARGSRLTGSWHSLIQVRVWEDGAPGGVGVAPCTRAHTVLR